LLIASIACSQSAPAVPVQDPNAVNTSIAQEIAARQTEAALKNPPTATSTFTPEIPTLTLEPTFTVTPDYTPTSETPMITVSRDTNCRVGPGAVYERVGVLLVGETTEIVGREPKGEFWYVRNLDEGSEYCWLWGEYATVTGNIYTLYSFTPVPPPLTAFGASFTSLVGCQKTWWVNLNMTNDSDALFQSITIVLTDSETNTVVTMTSNDFVFADGCDASEITDYLVTGGTVNVSSAPFQYNPKGHSLNARITACTGVDQGGTCVTKDVPFKPE
jgi:hypothetical protein